VVDAVDRQLLEQALQSPSLHGMRQQKAGLGKYRLADSQWVALHGLEVAQRSLMQRVSRIAQCDERGSVYQDQCHLESTLPAAQLVLDVATNGLTILNSETTRSKPRRIGQISQDSSDQCGRLLGSVTLYSSPILVANGVTNQSRDLDPRRAQPRRHSSFFLAETDIERHTGTVHTKRKYGNGLPPRSSWPCRETPIEQSHAAHQQVEQE
jgi:hypothetical protein